MMRLTRDVATAIVKAAFEQAERMASKPLCVVVLDAGAHPLALSRHEDASLFRAEIATAKAHGALGMGSGTRALAERAEKSPMFFASLSAVTAGRIIPVPGGVLIRDDEARIIGAVGVSGDLADVDEACASAGIEAVGLDPDSGGTQSN